MASNALDLTRPYEDKSAKQPVRILPYPERSSDVSHGEPMTKAEREELAELKEMVHQLVAKATVERLQPQPQANGSKWFMAAIASITILGAAGNFVGSSGMYVGKSQTDLQYQSEQVKELKEQVQYLKTWNEKLRNNMSAYGWLIDNDGNVSRIEQKTTRRR